ncbi:hypothetical protein TNIN_115971 [Trichonephila inaurata madagascariensis]|uniref:Uncharacterized protein n=1 Tax=Trichonephila inaurata madagascariensis TaxID=2747483 RepID=A0A8X6YHV2_9ARAC|nr:hypothetical protein TNIN_115971 [Trichonephila inaurata madagascariensis]
MEALPECEYGERPIGLVTSRMGHGTSPEIIVEEGGYWIAAHDVRVRYDGHEVVVYKLSAKGIEVAAGREQGHENVCPPVRHPLAARHDSAGRRLTENSAAGCPSIRQPKPGLLIGSGSAPARGGGLLFSCPLATLVQFSRWSGIFLLHICLVGR